MKIEPVIIGGDIDGMPFYWAGIDPVAGAMWVQDPENAYAMPWPRIANRWIERLKDKGVDNLHLVSVETEQTHNGLQVIAAGK